MSDDDFNFLERRSQRQINEVREAEEARIREQKLKERAQLLAKAIKDDFHSNPLLKVEVDGMSVSLSDRNEKFLIIDVMDNSRYSLRCSDPLVKPYDLVPKDEMMDLVDIWTDKGSLPRQ
jgi:hypothetical protein